jgi:HK97 family phage portal protein
MCSRASVASPTPRRRSRLIPYRRTSSGRQRLSSGRLHDLLQSPAPGVTQANLIGQAVAHLNLFGSCYVGKFRDSDGRLEQLGLLSPDQVQVERLNGQPRYTVTDAKTGRQTIHGADDVVHVHGLSIDGLVGLSPIGQCRLAISLNKGLGEFAESFTRHGGRPSAILSASRLTADRRRRCPSSSASSTLAPRTRTGSRCSAAT